MASKSFPKELLQGMSWGDCEEGYTILETQQTGTSRWSIHYTQIFSAPDGNLYKTGFSRGATEMQDESPYEYAGDMIECEQVFAHVVPKTVYLNTPAN